MTRFLTCCILLGVLIGCAAATIMRTGTRDHVTNFGGYWHTSDTRILDSAGRRVRIAGVTWYGMESTYWVPAGLNFQKYTAIMDTVKNLGYNTIRLPYSNELVETNPIVTTKVDANPQLRGKHALEVLDSIVSYAQQIGLKIILDNHRCHAASPKRVNFLDEPLWYAPGYPESSWIKDWQNLARRYLHQDAVIGFDLRNEPHTDGPGPWTTRAYLQQGATWGPYNGVDSIATDWRLAAERGGDAALAVNPHLLMFVEGVQLYPNPSSIGGVDTFWWGSILTGARQFPVVLHVPHQLVYSPHDWGPWKWNMSWFPKMSYLSMQRVWADKWSYLIQNPREPYATPIWIGEFGTCHTNPGCIDLQAQGNQAQWFHLILRFLREHREIGWSFFALDGSNSNDHVTNNGLLNAQWNAVSDQALQNDLRDIQP